MTPATSSGTVTELTLDEKVSFLEGTNFWNTRAFPRLGISSLFVTDGPNGVRKARQSTGAFGVADNVPSTAFPPAATVANSWSVDNARLVGSAIARECIDLDVQVVLAPGINIKRNPLCGRNFEYFSEDPLVAGVLGTAFVQGVESEGVASSVKHFAANSNEDFRFVGDSLVDERALREIYLRQFERVVTEAKPSTVMCAYNSINGVFASDNRELLTSILREQWGFDGLVVTDWGATHDRVASLNAGCDLDMPGDNAYNHAQVVAAVTDGRISRATLDASVDRMLALVERATRPHLPEQKHDPDEHAELSLRVAKQGAVLLKNDGTLPLAAAPGPLTIVGELFDRMRFQGAGSSLINPTRIVTPLNAFDARGIRYTYARGYRSNVAQRDDELEQAALADIDESSTVLFFGGLSDLEESEGFDRTTLALGENQTALLERILDTGAKVVLVLFAGAPVELPFLDRLSAVLDMYLPGMIGGEAVAALLFGEANPSGKLAESWPLTAADASSAADFDRDRAAQYYESIYVGYRAYDKAATPLQFPFGHGLSYTRFAYRTLGTSISGDVVSVAATIENIGERDGAEVVQLYVRNNHGEVFKAEKELRAFTRVEVSAGETVRATLSFALSELSYWDPTEHGWVLENGDYEILLAASSSDVRLRAPLRVTTGRQSKSPYSAAVNAAYRMPPQTIPAAFQDLLGARITPPVRSNRLGLETRLVDARRSIIGRIMYRAVLGQVEKQFRAAVALPDGLERDAQVKNTNFLVRMMPFNSLRAMAMSSTGALPYNVADGIADLAAWHPLRGLRKILRRR